MFSTTFHVISRKFWLLFGQRLSVCRCTLYSCRVCPALIFNTEWMWRCLRGFWHDFYFIVFVACECLVSWSHSRSESFWPNPDRNHFGRIRSQTGLSRIKWNLFSFQTELESVKFFWGGLKNIWLDPNPDSDVMNYWLSRNAIDLALCIREYFSLHWLLHQCFKTELFLIGSGARCKSTNFPV